MIVNAVVLELAVYVESPAKVTTTLDVPFPWVSVRVVDATPPVPVVAVTDWVPIVKVRVYPTRALPEESLSVAFSITESEYSPFVAPP